MFKGVSERHIRERNERTTQAYFTAVIPLMKKIPKLDTLLVHAAEKPQQTSDQHLAIVKSWMAGRRC